MIKQGMYVTEVGACEHMNPGRGNCWHQPSRIIRVLTWAVDYGYPVAVWAMNGNGEAKRLPMDRLVVVSGKQRSE